MKNNRNYLITELICLFVIVPAALVLEIPIFIRVGIVILGIIYVLAVGIKNRLVSKKSLHSMPTKPYWKIILIRFAVLALFSTILMYFLDNKNFFNVVLKDPVMWITFTVIYSVLSVYPQEFIYRSFFFRRYKSIVENPYVFILINALVFSFAHIGFKDAFVLFLTFIGGITFAISYHKTKSLMLTSIEHAIYGSWLFTVGMGEMLAFPTPQ